MTKVCSKCGLEKDTAQFYVKDKKTGRLDSKCKECVKPDRAAYYQDNKEDIAVTHRQYYEDNKEKVFVSVTRWRKENPKTKYW